MDADRLYGNAALEARRLAFLHRLKTEELPPDSHEGCKSAARQIALGLNLNHKARKRHLAEWVGQAAIQMSAADKCAFRELLVEMARRNSPMLAHRKLVFAMARLARYYPRWLHEPVAFSANSHDPSCQFADLARFLLARWPVPKFFDYVWDEFSNHIHRQWFIHLGAGGNLRTAGGLPFPLTKMMAHHVLLAPNDVSIVQALRWGQVRALGGSERVARAIIGTLLRDPQRDEPFWLSVIHFLAANPMLDPHRIGPMIDWIHNQRFVGEPPRIVNGILQGGGIPQSSMTMKGRTVDSVLRQVECWHRQLGRTSITGATAWPSSGIAGYELTEGTEGSHRIICIDELVNAADLQQEGRWMHHCVASYSHYASRGTVAIFSLKVDDGRGQERRLTIEVDVRTRRIVQARGRFNVSPTSADARYLRDWATVSGLTVVCF